MKTIRGLFLAVFIMFAVSLLAVAPVETQGAKFINLATTTSVENTGLLARILPVFEKNTGIKVHVIAVGTGQALGIARRGDADVVLVHDPEAEKDFIDEGFGINHTKLMHNEFVLAGPASDPAGVGGGKDIIEALKKIAGKKAVFVSRGDKSGTHMAELRMWAKAGIKPVAPWYIEAGQGQIQTLLVAKEKGGYALSDSATFITSRSKTGLDKLVSGDASCFNEYSAIAVNPKKNKGVKYDEAMKFINWLSSPETQKIIGDFKFDGNFLFVPELKQ